MKNKLILVFIISVCLFNITVGASDFQNGIGVSKFSMIIDEDHEFSGNAVSYTRRLGVGGWQSIRLKRERQLKNDINKES